MGYRFEASLYIQNVEEEEGLSIIAELRENSIDAELAFNEDGYCNREMPDWEHEKKLKEFSKKYPNVLFRLICDSSQSESWIDYFKDGKMQRCEGETIYPEYDESKLTSEEF